MIRTLYQILYKTKTKTSYLFNYRSIKLFLNLVYPAYCIIKKTYKYGKNVNNVIVSLTSFPARIDSVWLTIETLLRQTYRPEKIILWLADTQFESLEKLPKKLLDQQKRGLVINFCDDLRSHKKYYYSMKNFPNHIVITVDDDTFYPEDLVEELLYTHNKYPNTICCNIGHIIKVENGEVLPYRDWLSEADGYNQPSHYLLPTGCEGVLYPPGCLNENVFDKEQIKELCPLADDIWLKAMATLNGVRAVKNYSTSIVYANLISAQKGSLNKINVDKNMNDIQMENIIERYPVLNEIWK